MLDLFKIRDDGPVVRDIAASRRLYDVSVGIPVKEEGGGYLHTEALKGANSFALCPLSQAAQYCFGRASWPGLVPFHVGNLFVETRRAAAIGDILNDQNYFADCAFGNTHESVVGFGCILQTKGATYEWFQTS